MNVTKATNKLDRLANRPANPKIRSCYPVSGDWFHLSTDNLGERAWMQRVALWALIEQQHSVDHVQGICDGMPAGCGEDELGREVNYVYGPDLSPVGKTWADVYREASPINGEVTHLLRDHIREGMERTRKLGGGESS